MVDTDTSKIKIGYSSTAKKIIIFVDNGTERPEIYKDITTESLLAVYTMLSDMGGAVQLEDKDRGKYVQMVVEEIAKGPEINQSLN
jgi:hypothetical protein